MGCSQTAHILAVRETDAPQWGQVRPPPSLADNAFVGSNLRMGAGSDLRLGTGSASPHIKHVRAEALTSAPH
jgi:hypothetical protein